MSADRIDRPERTRAAALTRHATIDSARRYLFLGDVSRHVSFRAVPRTRVVISRAITDVYGDRNGG